MMNKLKMNNKNRPVLLFDLGGVLVKITTFEEIIRLSRKQLPPQQIKDIWLGSQTVKLFETGKIDSETFTRKLIEELDLEISEKEFPALFSSWMEDPYPGVFTLLKELKDHFTLGCLSNTNSIHFEKIEKQWNLPDYFDFNFFSHQMGCLKPDREIFDKVKETLPAETKEIIFFDDSRLNIEAAEKAGIKACLVEGFEAVKKELPLLYPEFF